MNTLLLDLSVAQNKWYRHQEVSQLELDGTTASSAAWYTG